MRLVRLFVSSTFADFQAERALLHDTVFPRVARYCRERGLSFQPVDLRWGVTDELAADQQTMQVCLAEVRRSQQLSPRPNCLILLGDRYGWRPLPDTLDADIVDTLALLADADEARALHAAYAPDANALPPAYRLRRSDEYGAAGAPDEERLRALLQRAATHVDDAGRRVALCGAATHQEVMLAALGEPARTGDVVAWLRNFDQVPEHAGGELVLGDYLQDGARDHAAAQDLARLKDALRATLPADVWAEETVPLAAYRADGAALASYWRRFARHVLRCLLKHIRTQVALLDAQARAEADPEDAAHRRFGAARSEGLRGREGELADIAAYLHGVAPQPLVLTGPGGTGKTSILAGAAMLPGRGARIVRFVGATPASASLHGMVADLCRQLDRIYRPDAPALPLLQGESLAAALDARMRLASAARPLTVMVDALDQFPTDQHASLLRWLPPVLPPHVRVVLTCRDGFPVAPRALVTAVPPLPLASARCLLDDWLRGHGRTLTREQHAAIEAGYALCPLPLWLRLASEQARAWRSDSPAASLPPTLEGMVALVFDNLRRRHAPVLLRQALAYLGASRYGLSEVELTGLLATDPAVLEEFRRNSRHPWDVASHGLPPVLWSRLRLDLGPYLIERGIDGTLLLAFFHREFNDVVVRDLVAPQAPTLHATLAGRFARPAGPDLPLLVERGDVPAQRRLSEQAFQLQAAGDHAGLQGLLGDFAYTMAKCSPERLPELMREHAALPASATPDALFAWRDFLRGHAGLLAQADARWPAYKVLLQLAQEQAEAHPIAQASGAWLATGACSWRWARRERRPSILQVPAILAQFPAPAGEEKAFEMTVALEGTRIATVGWEGPGAGDGHGYDAVVRIWNTASGLLEHELDGEGGSVLDLLALPGGRIATLAKDRGLRVWSLASGACLVKTRVEGARQLALLDDARVLLACDDPPRSECRCLDTLALLASAGADVWRRVHGLGNGLALLSHLDVDGSDPRAEQDEDTCYWSWEPDPDAQHDPVRLDYRRRLGAPDGSTLLWSAGSSAALLLGGAATRRSAILPAPAADARLVKDFGAAVALADGRYVLFDWHGTVHVVLDPRATRPGTGAAPPDEDADAPRWGLCALGDGTVLSWQCGGEQGYEVQRWRRDGTLLGGWNGAGVLDELVPGPQARVLAHYVYRMDGDEQTYPVECRDGRDGTVLATMLGHFNYIDHVGWLPGERVVSWSEDDGTIRTWDARNGAQLALFNLQGFIEFLLPLADGTLLVSGYNALFRFNLDFRDEAASPCGGLQMPDGLALAWDDANTAVLWRTRDRRVLAVADNSGDIARVRRCGDGLIVWDRTLEQWRLWADGARRRLATVLPGAPANEDDPVFRRFGDVLVSLVPQEGEELLGSDSVLMQRHLPDGEVKADLLALPSSGFLEGAYILSPDCVALVGKAAVIVHRVDGDQLSVRSWQQGQRLRHHLQLASGLVCCFGRLLASWNEAGEPAMTRLLPEPPCEMLALDEDCLLVCMPGSVLMLDMGEHAVVRQHRGPDGFRYYRATRAGDGRVLLECRSKRQAAIDVLDRDGTLQARLMDTPMPGKVERLSYRQTLEVDVPRPLLHGDQLVACATGGRWQRWSLATGLACGAHAGMPDYAELCALDDGRLLWAKGNMPVLFSMADGTALAAAQPARAGLWLRAAPSSDTANPGLLLLGASGWDEGAEVFWTNAQQREVVALSDAVDGRILLKGANHFSKHQHSGFWVRLMDGAHAQQAGPSA